MPRPAAAPERARLAALARLRAAGGVPVGLYKPLLALGAHALGTPIAAVGLVDAAQVAFPVALGLPAGFTAPRLDAFLHPAPLVVGDVSSSPDWAASPLVGALGVRFYAGAPLRTPAGQLVGALSLMDRAPRDASDLGGDLFALLEALAAAATAALERPGPKRRARPANPPRAEVLELIARGAPLPAVLLHLTRALEAAQPGLWASVSRLEGGRLLLEVAPSLPNTLARALEALPITPRVGALAAAARGERVLTADVRSDPLWHPFRFAALQHGLHAVCADPIVSDEGEVLGTFHLYSREVAGITEERLRDLREAAQLASLALTRERLQQRLQHQARHDPLTGLPNRALMHERLEQTLAHAQRTSGVVAALLLDLDDFKRVNDALGHATGDRLLQEVARRLRAAVRALDTVARLGGDEFVIIAPLAAAEDAPACAQRVLEALRPPFKVQEHTFEMRASVGVSLYPCDAQDAETLLRAADSALYAAKGDARASFHRYQQAMTETLETRLTLEVALREALAVGALELFAQPRFALRTGAVAAFEALVRWPHPERGLLLPGCFLEVAERGGLMASLDAWVFEQALVHLSRWQRLGLPYRLSCNLSAASFRRGDVAAGLGERAGRYGVDPARLELEVTEDLLMHDLDRAAQQLRQLKAQLPGLRVALDDFGRGYSSLAYLRHLPLDTLKIDRAFVADLAAPNLAAPRVREGAPRTQRTALAVIRAVVALGHELGLSVVAEGVESAAQLGMLTALGVDEVQGFFVGSPAPLREVAGAGAAPVPDA